jgi:thiol-disulfide isomerase/thioredoxin
MNSLLIIGMVIIFGIIAYNLYNNFYKKYNKNFITNNEFKPNTTIEVVVILFYVKWCKYSDSTKALWDVIKVSDKYNNNTFNITFIEVDCDTTNSLIDEYKIKEYPTIILVKNDKKYIYDANLREDTFDLFVNTIMNE